ncbi:Mysoin-binding motif of peroxisomes-domain-containing protein [Pilaira anomala]|nr:Mysoin-binding motif of peroxisomes-domain-containing protein [Pilaira anomala]
MSEFVVYEDSPLDEYLQSIDQKETTVKVTPPSLNINGHANQSISSRPDISKMWRYSMFHDAFSISLPRSEETAFEEKFKYLIVTSPLLNETLSVHHNRHTQQQQATFQASAVTTSKLGLVTNLVTTLAALLGADYMMHHKIPVITLFLSTSTSVILFYQHKRRSIIRKLYQIALSRMGSFTNHCDTFDTKVHRCLITIQEIELVSRGYRLSTPLSPISRIEQNSKSRKCVQLRNRLASVLRRAFILYEEGIIDLMDVIHKKNLNTLYEMYNVHSIASLSAMGDEISGDEGYSLDQLKKLAQIMHSKRRECMVHFLALGVMTEDHDSVHYNYSDGWRLINDVLGKLVEETEKFTIEIVEALDAEFYKPIHGFDKKSDNSKIEDDRLKKFVHRLSSLEQQLRTMEAKIYLCSEDVRQLNSSSTEQVREKLLNEYMSVQKGFENMIQEWEHGKDVLESFLNPVVTNNTSKLEPKQEQEEQEVEEEEETEGKGMILDSEDVADILNLPLASKASVYEAIAGVVEKNGREKSKMTRKERIEEMRVKRTKEAEDKLNRMDSQTMVHELKSVLFKRVNDLDLEQEDDTPPTYNE